MAEILDKNGEYLLQNLAKTRMTLPTERGIRQ